MHAGFFAIGTVTMFAGLLAARQVAATALKGLGDQDKLRLVDGLSAQRAGPGWPMLAIVALFLALLWAPPSWQLPGYAAVCLLFASLIVWQGLRSLRQLRELGLPEAYMATLRLAHGLARGGLLLFLACLLLTLR